jgi:hypothetical protein
MDQQHAFATARGPRGTRRAAPDRLAAVALYASLCLLALSGGVWAAGRVADSGTFLLLAAIAFAVHISRAAPGDFPATEAIWGSWCNRLDRLVAPIVLRADQHRTARDELDLLVRMRAERSRRVEELGELVYRSLRRESDNADVPEAVERVRNIERQMLMQEQKVRQLDQRESHEASAAGDAAHLDQG